MAQYRLSIKTVNYVFSVQLRQRTTITNLLYANSQLSRICTEPGPVIYIYSNHIVS